ncbi:DUF4422 domain-containing protein [Xylanibacter oryzae]|uniref:DUF4422 domain-containing protein n=1 Tax=Xylanibacter oryzae TaxID=185293 RepID=UPI0004B3D670|nr:DUF4422 domain-containing protein [Xylanibacter oryzae]
MEKTIVFICAHKEVELPQHEFFMPIQAGTGIGREILPYTPDNTGDNISVKNKNYCELTCHYWVWKNLKNVGIVGLNHYRRYFDFEKRFLKFAPDRSFISADSFLSKTYKFPNLEGILKKYDIILPNTRNYPYNMATQYGVFHIVDDWVILKDVIKELSPEYIPAFEKTMEHRNYSSNYNMFITKWNYFDEYSEWLFKILFEVEKRCKISSDPVQSRLFGYMSERLINVYCEYKHLRIKHVPIIVPIDDFDTSMNPSYLRYNWWKFRNNFVYHVNKLL